MHGPTQRSGGPSARGARAGGAAARLAALAAGLVVAAWPRVAPASPPPASPPPGGAPAPSVIPGIPELRCDLAQLRARYDIPIEINDAVVKHLRRFLAPGARPGFRRWLSIVRRDGPWIRAILREQGVPEDLLYLALVESGFSVHARSPAGAVGPWQLLAGTARQLGLRQDRWVDERRDPEKAARAAAQFLRSLHARTGDWPLAWAAYNAGPGRVARALRRGPKGFWELERRRLLPAETRDYVPRILAVAIIARHPEVFGLREAEGAGGAPRAYEWVVVPRSTPIARLAAAAGADAATLRALNPELRRSVTPPRPYLLRIPREGAVAFAEAGPATWRAGARAPARATRLARAEGVLPPGARLALDDAR